MTLNLTYFLRQVVGLGRVESVVDRIISSTLTSASKANLKPLKKSSRTSKTSISKLVLRKIPEMSSLI